MFTGIVTDVGQVRHIEKRGDAHVVIGANYDVSTVDAGASVACSGICMTVVARAVPRTAGSRSPPPARPCQNGAGAQILLDLGIKDMILLTDTPEKKAVALEGYGLNIVGTHPIRGGQGEQLT